MGTNIVWQNIYPESAPPGLIPGAEKMWAPVLDLFAKVRRPDTEITIQNLKRSAFYVTSSYLELLNTGEVIDGVIKAEKAGADVVIIGCGNDPGLQQAREVVDIPVVGIVESSALMATMLGNKFAVVTILDKLVPLVERNLRTYGLESRMISHRPVRSIDVNFERFSEMLLEPRKRMIADFERVAKECIADGAEVIVTACGFLGPGLLSVGYNHVGGTSVPIVDCVTGSIKTAEMLSDLRKVIGISTSKHNLYKLPLSKEKLDHYRLPFTCIPITG